ncbi:hypothetical protein L4D15_14820 [Enterovibrio norvegicus]|uniref:hypothetical protein n=1 Tax=Enterovibrio norvegicus TaxID=188144 RepID=UPI003D0D3A7D
MDHNAMFCCVCMDVVVMKKLILVVSFLFLFTGCQLTSQTGIYNPNRMDSQALATVYTSEIRYAEFTLWAPLRSGIVGLYSHDFKEIELDGIKNKYSRIQEIKLSPGDYIVRGSCYRGDMYAYPFTQLSVKKGKSYVLVCKGDKEEISIFEHETMFMLQTLELSEFKKIELGELISGSNSPQLPTSRKR